MDDNKEEVVKSKERYVRVAATVVLLATGMALAQGISGSAPRWTGEGHFPYFLHDRSHLWATLVGDTLLTPLRAGDDHCERRPEAGLLQPDVEPAGHQRAHLRLRHLLLYFEC